MIEDAYPPRVGQAMIPQQATIARDRTFPLTWAVLSIAAVLPFILSKFPPLYDFYHWVFQGHLVATLLWGPPAEMAAVSRLYGLQWGPIPNLAAPLGIAVLSLGLSPVVAGRVFLALCVLGFAAAYGNLVRAVQDHPTALELLGFLWAFGYFMYKGYDSYLLGLALALLAIRVLHRSTGGAGHGAGRGALVLLTGLGGLVYLSHLLGWAVLATALGLYSLGLWRRRQWRAGLLLLLTQVPVLGLLAWYAASASGASQIDLYHALSDKLLSLIEPFLFVLRTDPLDPLLSTFWVNVAGYVLLAVILLAGLERPVRAQSVPLLLTGLLLGAIGIVLPISALGEAIRPDERLLLPALLLVLAAVRFRAPRLAWALTAAMLVVLLLGYHLLEYQRSSATLEQLQVATTSTIPPQASVLALSLFVDETHGRCTAGTDVFSVGTPALKWFDLYRLLDIGQERANIMETSLVHIQPGAAAAQDLTVLVLSPAQMEIAGGVGSTFVARYAYVEVVGCRKDVANTALALSPQYRLVRDGSVFAILQRQATP